MIPVGFAFIATTRGELQGVAGWMASLVDALGPLGVGLIALLETVFPPIPSEAILPAAGYLAGLGELEFWPTLICATSGSVVGALLWYWAGAGLGPERISRIATRVPLVSSQDVERAWAAFDRWQTPAVFWGRLVPGVRSLVSIPAGADRMPLRRFLLLTTSGSALWNFVLMAAGWWLGDRFGATARVSHWINFAIFAAIAVLGARWLVSALQRRRLQNGTSGGPT